MNIERHIRAHIQFPYRCKPWRPNRPGASTTCVNKHNQWRPLWERWAERRFAHFYNHNFSLSVVEREGQRASTPSTPCVHHRPVLLALSLSSARHPLSSPSAPTNSLLKAVDTTILSGAASLSVRAVYFELYLEQGPGRSCGPEAEPVLREIRQTGTL